MPSSLIDFTSKSWIFKKNPRLQLFIHLEPRFVRLNFSIVFGKHFNIVLLTLDENDHQKHNHQDQSPRSSSKIVIKSSSSKIIISENHHHQKSSSTLQIMVLHRKTDFQISKTRLEVPTSHPGPFMKKSKS